MKVTAILTCLLAIAIPAPKSIAAEPPPIGIEGQWRCGPYTMKTAKFSVTGSNTVEYRRSGEYAELATMTITSNEGTKTTLTTQTQGSWSQSSDVLQTTASKVQVLSSDNPRYPLEAAQKAADEQQAKQSIAKNKIRVRSNSMTLRPINPSSKEADINIVCRRM
jgi:hypothetical protein